MGAFVTSTQTTTNWAVSAYAICAAGARLVSTTSRDVTGGMWTREAPCPAGTESTGLGGEVALGFPAIWLRHVRTTDDIDRTQVLAGGQGNGPWELTAHAICRTETAGTTIASVAGPSDPAVSQSVTAACPGGTRVVGAGGDAAGGTEEEPFDVSDYVHVTAVRPDAALRAVTVTAEWYHPMGVTGPWRPQAWAICAPAPPGLERVSASSPVTTDVHAYAVAGCPAGKHLIGIGGEIAGGGRYKGFDDLAPDPGLTRVSVLASGHDSAGTSPWSVTAYAICVSR